MNMNRYTSDYIVFAAGICNLTEKNDLYPRRIEYNPTGNTVSSIIGKLRQLKHTYGIKMNIATLPPAALIKNFHHKNDISNMTPEFKDRLETQLARQQVSLLNDMKDINDAIINMNDRFNTECLEWNRKVFSATLVPKKLRSQAAKSDGKRKLSFKPSALEDGVHPTEKTREIWFNRLHELTVKELKKLTKLAPKKETN